MPEPREPYQLPQRSPQELALIAVRKERALRWQAAGYSLNGYPTLPAEVETPATLAAEPPEQSGRR
jgi:hypothetical protein